jgi:hypothetical protein
MFKEPVILIGLGEMAAIFARALLKLGHPVYPLRRGDDLAAAAAALPAPLMVLVAVGESDLQPLLQQIPSVWHDRIALLQNELLPRDWQDHPFHNPTVISVWFEKKPGQDFRILIPSPCFGPHARLLHDALATLGIPARVVADEAAMLHELVVKNLYILTTNIAGLQLPAGTTVERLWHTEQALLRAVAADVLKLQNYLSGGNFSLEPLLQSMLTAIEGDPAHACMGRSAPLRLQRALAIAESAGLALQTLPKIANELTS